MKELLKIFLFIAPVWILIHSCRQEPEELLIGSWQEEKWETNEKLVKELNQNHRHILKRHQIEKWVFTKNNQFEIIMDDGKVSKGKWSLLGRGHILKLKYEDTGETEIFNIKDLTETEMILNADIGLEIIGISKLYFVKKNNT